MGIVLQPDPMSGTREISLAQQFFPHSLQRILVLRDSGHNMGV
jgi:hypothetical protein